MSEIIATNTKGAIKTLKESPLFNLSLGSKELFHSNFLHWLANRYPQETGELFSAYLKDNSGDTSIKEAYREKGNVDLYLIFNNGQHLIIENKVKSIPNIQQLDQYVREQLADKDADSKNFLLLSLTRPKFVTGKTSKTEWHFLDYGDLSKMILGLSAKIKDQYDQSIIKDYVKFISALQVVEAATVIDFTNNKFDFNDDSIAVQMGNIRLADLYLKKKYLLIAEELTRALKRRFQNAVFLTDWEKDRQLAKEGSIYINSGMTRAQGLVEVFYVVKQKKLAMGVQIQGNDYRKFVLGKNSEAEAKKLKAEGLWFDFSRIGKKLPEYPTRAGKEFRSYNGEFFYRSVTIPKTLTVGKIVKSVIEDIASIAPLVKSMAEK